MDMQELIRPPSQTWLYTKGAPDLLRRYPDPLKHGLPELKARANDVAFDAEALAEFNRVCGSNLTSRVPPTYPHVLSFRMQVLLMTSKDFPLSSAGVLHVTNTITQRRWIDMSERFDLEVRIENLAPHPKGLIFESNMDLFVDGEVVWSESNTYLRKGAFPGSEDATSEDDIPPTLPQHQAVWDIPADLGKQYASVSGDYNPIHVNRPVARLVGGKKLILQGLWGIAHSLAMLDPQLPSGGMQVDSRFRRPIPLGIKAGFTADIGAEATTFAMVRLDDEKPYFTGQVTPL